MSFSIINFDNSEDYINATAIFSGVRKTIHSRNFKGGKINNLFGGTELDFSNADINGTAILDISQAFGETKIIVPENWLVTNDLSQIIKNIDDRRAKLTAADNNKQLVLKGVSILAGVNILDSGNELY